MAQQPCDAVWLKSDLDFIKERFDSLGVLSIDVDGNDYWFLKELISTRPSVIVVEYNASFGLEPVTVPVSDGLTAGATQVTVTVFRSFGLPAGARLNSVFVETRKSEPEPEAMVV